MIRESDRGLAHYLARDWACYITRNWDRSWSFSSHREWTHDWAASQASYNAEPFSEKAEELGFSPQAPWVQAFFLLDSYSLERTRARVDLAFARFEKKNAETSLLSQACYLSLHPDGSSKKFDRLLTRLTPKLDPLWPALARHLARRSTPEDRALLTDLAQHPEKREAPLSWGLQFIVRGDVMLADGETVVTLDELADEAGVPRLPYLEDMPDELEVDWEEE
jgi:hypothetical protein